MHEPTHKNPSDNIVDEMVEMAAKLSNNRRNRENLNYEDSLDLRQNMLLNALQAWTSWDPSKSSWEARCWSVMSWTNTNQIRSPFHVPEKPARVMRQLIHTYGIDDTESIIDGAVDKGMNRDAASTIANNLGTPVQLSFEGSIMGQQSNSNIPQTGRKRTTQDLIDLASPLLSEGESYLDLKESLSRWYDQLTERQQKIWTFEEAGYQQNEIASMIDSSESIVSRELKTCKELLAEHLNK
jgi:RNA polymerase sigma factor (sigma-70 family)